jgi:hypothetical protein
MNGQTSRELLLIKSELKRRKKIAKEQKLKKDNHAS